MFILVLEDDPAVGALYVAALKGDGHQVALYSSFEEARKALRDSAPDALLTDVRVGSYNGLQLAIMFRSIIGGRRYRRCIGPRRPETKNISASFFTEAGGS